MSGRAFDDDAEVQKPAVADHELHRRRLRKHAPVGVNSAGDQGARAGRVLLFADHRRQRHITRGLLASAPQVDERAQHGGQPAFHVAGAATVEPLAVDLGPERVPGPSFPARDGVEVPGEKKMRTAAHLPPGDDVAPSWRDLLQDHLEAGVRAPACDGLRDRPFLTGRRRDADQALENRPCGALHASPPRVPQPRRPVGARGSATIRSAPPTRLEDRT